MRRAIVFPVVICVLIGFSSLALGLPVLKPVEQRIVAEDTPNLAQPGQPSFYGAQYSPYSGPDFPAATIPDTVWYGGTSTSSGRPLSAVGGKWTWSASGWGGVPHSGHYLDGWTSRDNRAMTDVYFRRSQLSGTPCTPIAGSWSFWCGVNDAEAAALCYAAGAGYGNNWYQILQNTIALSGDAVTTLEFDYACDCGLNVDGGYVEINKAGAWVVLPVRGGIGKYTGTVSGHEAVNIGSYLTGPGNYDIRFRFVSSADSSDQDGLNPTNCGGVIIDNIKITESTHGVVHSCDAETDDCGWHWVGIPGPGDWVHLDYNPVLEDPCMGSDPNWCQMADSFVVMYDVTAPPSAPHRDLQDNWVISPVIQLSGTAGEGLPGHLFQFERYVELPLLDVVFYAWYVKYFPYDCGVGPAWSPWLGNGTIYYSATKSCGLSTFELSGLVPACVESVQVAMGTLAICALDPWAYGCTYVNNKTPYFDNVRFGAVGDPLAPIITQSGSEKYLDMFPTDGTLNCGSTVNIGVSYAGNPGRLYSAGDTLVVHGLSCANSKEMEVWLHFKVRAGRCTNTQDPWFTVYPQNVWHSARMDTAEQSGIVFPGTWMGAFHEDDPNYGLAGGRWSGEGGEILPDGLFTPGTHIEYYVSSNYSAGYGEPLYSFELRNDEPGFEGQPDDVNVLPSISPDGLAFPCLLYVDAADGLGAQRWVEDALRCVPVNWDRYDKRAPTSAMKNGIGRAAGYEKGATTAQLQAYSLILLDALNVYTGAMEVEDTNLFTGWLAGAHSYNQRFLAIFGDEAARYLIANGTRKAFMNTCMGTTYSSRYYWSTSGNNNWCVNIADLAGNRIDGGAMLTEGSLRANRCPNSFNIIGVQAGTGGVAESEFSDANPTVHRNVVSNQVIDGASNVLYRTVFSSYSVARIRSLNCPGGVSSWNFGDSTGVCGTPALKGWQDDVRDKLVWGGLYGMCENGPTDITNPVKSEAASPSLDKLVTAYPNPMNPATTISFAVKSEGRVSLRVYDASGRLVRTLVDSRLKAGSHKVPWDGRNDSGVKVGSGVFFYQIEIEGGYQSAKKIVILK